MDPTETLRLIELTDIPDRGVEACENLQQWLRVGGFEPDWAKWRKGTAAFVRWRKRHNITNPLIAPESKTRYGRT